jgi:hypothetical protein
MLSPAVVQASVGLVVLYALVIIVWYELIRSLVVHRLRRRQGGEGNRVRSPSGPAAPMENGAHPGMNGHAPAHLSGPEELELERARRHFQRARQAAQAERDAAIEAANNAAQQAIGRIERRYREIDGAYIEQETERISEMLLRPAIDESGDSLGETDGRGGWVS